MRHTKIVLAMFGAMAILGACIWGWMQICKAVFPDDLGAWSAMYAGGPIGAVLLGAIGLDLYRKFRKDPSQ